MNISRLKRASKLTQHQNPRIKRRVKSRLIDSMYGLLTKCEVKMAGYWPSSFFLRVYGPRRSRGP